MAYYFPLFFQLNSSCFNFPQVCAVIKITTVKGNRANNEHFTAKLLAAAPLFLLHKHHMNRSSPPHEGRFNLKGLNVRHCTK